LFQGEFLKYISLIQKSDLKLTRVHFSLCREFGNNSIDLPSTSPLYFKTSLQAKLKEIGLPSLLIFNGPFADWIQHLIPVVDNEITIIGEGKADISFTSREDVSSFLVHILTRKSLPIPQNRPFSQPHTNYPPPRLSFADLPPSQLLNLVVPIEASRTSFGALAQLVVAKNPSTKIVYESHETALKRFAEKGDFVAWLKVEWDSGRGVSSAKEELKNDLWKEWNSTPVEKYL